MRPIWTAAALAAAVLAVSLRVAPAQDRCGPRDSVAALLADKYTEAQVALGVSHSGALVEVFATADGSTWTIVVTSPQGRSCMVAAGEAWRAWERVRTEPET